jgi:hypothetical protein
MDIIAAFLGALALLFYALFKRASNRANRAEMEKLVKESKGTYEDYKTLVDSNCELVDRVLNRKNKK